MIFLRSLTLSVAITASAVANTVEKVSGAEAVFDESLRSLMIGLLVLIAMLYLAYYLMRRVPGLPGQNSRQVRVKEVTGLSNREKLVVVEADGRRFMLGVAPGQVNLLTELDAVVEQEEGASMRSVGAFEKAMAFARGIRSDKDSDNHTTDAVAKDR